jgi:hypothetical protein
MKVVMFAFSQKLTLWYHRLLPTKLAIATFPYRSRRFAPEAARPLDDSAFLPASPKKSKKKFLFFVITGIALVGIITVVLISVFKPLVAPNSPDTTRREAYTLLWEFNDNDYSYLIELYEASIGLSAERDIEEWIFPTSRERLEQISAALGASKKNYENLLKITGSIDGATQEESKSVERIKERAGVTLRAIDTNVNLLNKFVEAFIDPLYDASEQLAGGAEIKKCNKTDAINFLLNSKDEAIRLSAEKYYAVQCAMLDEMAASVGGDQKPSDDVFGKANAAKKALRKCLVSIERATLAVDELSGILEAFSR